MPKPWNVVEHPTINMEGTLLNGFCSVLDAGLRDGETISATVRCDVDHRLLPGEKSRGCLIGKLESCLHVLFSLTFGFGFLFFV